MTEDIPEKKKEDEEEKDKNEPEHDDNDDEAEDDAEDDADGDDEEGEKSEKKSDSEAQAPSHKSDEKAATKKTKEEEEARKKKYANWPMRDIKEPHQNDVMYGRGGGTNHHPGNKIYRKTVEDRKLDYVNSKRLDKPLVALGIIREWRAQSPPGRFLKLDEKTGLWHDVGDKKAREKTSQALREKAPEIRKKQEEEAMIKAGKDPSDARESDKEKKATRFAEGTKNQHRDEVKHAVLARDHSLGREYLARDEIVALDGFTWDPASLDRNSSYGSVGPYPPGRVTSYGSHGAIPPHFPPSRVGSYNGGPGGPPGPVPPPPGDYYRNMSQEQRQQSFGSGRYDSWSRMPSGGSIPAPPMPPYNGNSHQSYRSGSFGSMQSMPISREHSLSYNPLRDASVSHPMTQATFDGHTGSGYWGPPSVPPPPPPSHSMPPHTYGGPRYTNGEDNHYGRSPSRSYQSSHAMPSAPPVKPAAPPPPAGRSYNIDPEIAKSWSTQSEDFEIAATMFSDQEIRRSWSDDGHRENERQQSSPRDLMPRRDNAGIARPDIVKRMTSNQNEDVETKRDYMGDGRSIKRAALNRDNSMASNRLKEVYAPGVLKKPQVLDNEMRSLSVSMEQSSLGTRPRPIVYEERTSTLDMFAMEMLSKPTPLDSTDRSSTIDELGIDLDDDGLLTPVGVLPKPPRLRTEGRLTTAEYFDIVNEPLGDD
ncbi:hypothetical protein MHU86_2031 [Fragilaria crotonensis]|nr:hypothetical protein MHU86_2031 [Fragilaria crotonensis]